MRQDRAAKGWATKGWATATAARPHTAADMLIRGALTILPLILLLWAVWMATIRLTADF